MVYLVGQVIDCPQCEGNLQLLGSEETLSAGRFMMAQALLDVRTSALALAAAGR